MVRDLIKKEIIRLKIKKENMDKIIDEAVKETEHFYGKSLKQLPPEGEAHDFLIELIITLKEEEKKKDETRKLVDEYCKSNKDFKTFLSELSTSGGLGLSRSELYDTTRVSTNDSVGSQNLKNMDNDDRDNENIWNQGVKDLEVRQQDLTQDVGEQGINKDDYFKQNNKLDNIADTYKVSQIVKFQQQDSDEQQEGEVIGIIDSDGKKQAKIKVMTGSDSGKILNINLNNIKGKIDRNTEVMNDDE